MKKSLLFIFISGILSLTAFSQSQTGTEYVTLPLSGELEYTPTTHFVYKSSIISDTIGHGGGFETKSSDGISHDITSHTLSLANNKVGIGGVLSPQQALHVGGSGLFSGRLAVGAAATNFYGAPKLRLLLGDLWTFSDMSNAKIMGYNSIFIENGSPGRRVDGYASAMMMNTDGSIQLCTAPYGTGVPRGEERGTPLNWNYVTMLNNGNVGIGVNNPQSKLQVLDGTFNLAFGNAESENLDWGTAYIGFNAVRNPQNNKWTLKGDLAHNGGSVIWTTVTGSVYFASIPSTGGREQILTDAQVKNNIKLLLTPDGVLKAKAVSVTLTGWPDYVFSSGYTLRNLDEVAAFIAENNRLPEMPSAAEIAEEGVDLGEMNALLLKKVEELTLYIIQQQKEIEELKKAIK